MIETGGRRQAAPAAGIALCVLLGALAVLATAAGCGPSLGGGDDDDAADDDAGSDDDDDITDDDDDDADGGNLQVDTGNVEDPEVLDLGVIGAGNGVEAAVLLWNRGDEPIDLLVVEVQPEELAMLIEISPATPPAWTMQPGAFEELSLSVTPGPLGDVEGVLQIVCTDPERPVIDVRIEGEVLAPPG